MYTLAQRFLSLFVAVLVISGCATNYNYMDAPPSLGGVYTKYAVIGYDGEIKDFSEVGVITTDGVIKINLIDRKPIAQFRVFKTSSLYPGGRYQLHLLPGTYKLSLSLRYDDGRTWMWSTSDLARTITVEKGQVLHLAASTPTRRTWTVKYHDGSGALPTIMKDFDELKQLHSETPAQ
jgi:hypothetical protein